MIKLDIREYCHACPHFEADVEVSEVVDFYSTDVDGTSNKYEAVCGDTIVRCTHRHKCKSMMGYLKNRGGKNE